MIRHKLIEVLQHYVWPEAHYLSVAAVHKFPIVLQITEFSVSIELADFVFKYLYIIGS